MTRITLQSRAEYVKGIHIESQMEDGAMQEYGGNQTPVFPLEDQFIYLHAHSGHYVKAGEGFASGLQDEKDNCDYQQGVGDVWTADGCADGNPLSLRWGLGWWTCRVLGIGRFG